VIPALTFRQWLGRSCVSPRARIANERLDRLELLVQVVRVRCPELFDPPSRSVADGLSCIRSTGTVGGLGPGARTRHLFGLLRYQSDNKNACVQGDRDAPGRNRTCDLSLRS